MNVRDNCGTNINAQSYRKLSLPSPSEPVEIEIGNGYGYFCTMDHENREPISVYSSTQFNDIEELEKTCKDNNIKRTNYTKNIAIACCCFIPLLCMSISNKNT
jgi:hypothetical protein